MGFMSSTSKRLATKAKSLTKKVYSSRYSTDSAPQPSDGTPSSRAAPGSFDFQPELYGEDPAQQGERVYEQQELVTLKPLSGAGKRPSRGSASLQMSDSAFSEGASTREGAGGRTGSTPMLAPASAGSWGDLRSSQESALHQGLGTPPSGSRGDLTAAAPSSPADGSDAPGGKMAWANASPDHQQGGRVYKDDSARQSAEAGTAPSQAYALTMVATKAAARSSFALERQSLDVNRATLKKFGGNHRFSLSEETPAAPVATEESVCIQCNIPPAIREPFLLLAALPRNTPVPLATLEHLWGCRDQRGSAQGTAQVMQAAGALHVATIGSGDLWCLVPPTQLQLLHAACKSRLPAMHSQLLTSYLAASGVSSLSDIEDDGYIVNNAGYHLVGAGRLAEMRKLLINPSWLETKLHAYGAASVVADFRRYLMAKQDTELKLVLEAFQMAASSSSQCPMAGMLAMQMAGRLMSVTTSAMIKEWCTQQRMHASLQARMAPNLPLRTPLPLRPRTATLEQAGGLQRLALHGHTAGVVRVAMLPSGVEAVTASKDGTLRVWDLEIGDCTLQLEGHTGAITCFDVNAAGDFLISGAADRSARLWELERGRCMRVLQGHLTGVCSVVMDPLTRFAVTLATDGVAWVWELAGGTCVHMLQSPYRSVLDTGLSHRVVLSPDSRTCITVGGGFEACVWDLSKGNLLRTLKGHSSWVVDTAISPDACRAVTASHDGHVRVWDLWSGACERALEGHNGRVNNIALSQDGQRLVSASDDTTLRVYDMRSCELRHVLKGHTAWINDVALTEGGALCATASGEPVCRVYDLARGECVRLLEGHSAEIHSVAMTRRGRFVVTGSEDGTARVWDLHAARRPPVPRHAGAVHAALATADGARVVTAGEDGTVRMWDADTGQQLGCMEHGSPVKWLALTDNGALAVSAGGNRSVRVWNLEDCTLYSELPPQQGSRLKSLAVAPDGAYAIITLWDSSVSLVDLASGDTIRTLCSGRGMRVSVDEGGAPQGHVGGVNGCVMAPDGHTCVTTSKDTTARVWDLQTGACRLVLEGHTDAVQHAAYSPSNSLILTCSYDGSARLWDATTGASLCVLPHDQAAPPTKGWVAGSGERVVTVDANGGAYLWHVVEEEGACMDDHFESAPKSATNKQDEQGANKQEDAAGCASAHPVTTHAIDEQDDTTSRPTTPTAPTVTMHAHLIARLGSVAGSEPAVVGVAFSPDGARVATCGQDGTVVVYEATRGAAQGVFRVDAPCRSCTFAGTSEWVLVVGTDPGQVHFLEHA